MALVDDLVAWYDGEDASDSHGSNPLTGIGTPTYTAGKVDNAATFDGSTDGLTAGAFFNPGTSDFTVAFWVKIANATTWRFCTGQSKSAGSKEWEFRSQVTSGKMNFHYEDTGGAGSISILGATNIANNAYHFVVGIRNGTSVELYVDDMGTLDGSATDSTPYNISNTHPFTLGVDGDTSTRHFWLSGQIDSVGLWTRALSEAERDELYNAGAGVAYADIAGASTIVKDPIQIGVIPFAR